MLLVKLKNMKIKPIRLMFFSKKFYISACPTTYAQIVIIAVIGQYRLIISANSFISLVPLSINLTTIFLINQ